MAGVVHKIMFHLKKGNRCYVGIEIYSVLKIQERIVSVSESNLIAQN